MRLVIEHPIIRTAEDLVWAIDVVNAVLGSSEAFKSLYMPLVRLFPEGASVDGNMLYHRVRTCGDVSVDIRYVPKDLLTQMECFPVGSRNHEMRKAILVSPWLLTGQNDPSLSADSHLNAKYINLNSLFHEVAHLLTPMINEELGRKRDELPPLNIGKFLLDGRNVTDAGYGLEGTLYSEAYLSNTDNMYLFLTLILIFDKTAEAKGENTLRKKVPLENVKIMLEAIEDWKSSLDGPAPASCCGRGAAAAVAVPFPRAAITSNTDFNSLEEVVPTPPPSGAIHPPPPELSKLQVSWAILSSSSNYTITRYLPELSINMNPEGGRKV